MNHKEKPSQLIDEEWGKQLQTFDEATWQIKKKVKKIRQIVAQMISLGSKSN